MKKNPVVLWAVLLALAFSLSACSDKSSGGAPASSPAPQSAAPEDSAKAPSSDSWRKLTAFLGDLDEVIGSLDDVDESDITIPAP
jgi:uncharacterized lipoprotein YbaY